VAFLGRRMRTVAEIVEWLRAEVALAVKRSCRREFGIRPVIVPVIV